MLQLTFAEGFGGGALSALLIMRPTEVPINLFTMNIDLIWTLVWWALNYFPYDLPGRVHRLLPVRMASKACLNVRKGLTGRGALGRGGRERGP